jgi:hypothetical protein
MSIWANELHYELLSLSEMIYLNLFYYFMILFQCNNIIILSLIIFLLNYNQHIIDIRYCLLILSKFRREVSLLHVHTNYFIIIPIDWRQILELTTTHH